MLAGFYKSSLVNSDLRIASRDNLWPIEDRYANMAFWENADNNFAHAILYNTALK